MGLYLSIIAPKTKDIIDDIRMKINNHRLRLGYKSDHLSIYIRSINKKENA